MFRASHGCRITADAMPGAKTQAMASEGYDMNIHVNTPSIHINISHEEKLSCDSCAETHLPHPQNPFNHCRCHAQSQQPSHNLISCDFSIRVNIPLYIYVYIYIPCEEQWSCDSCAETQVQHPKDP